MAMLEHGATLPTRHGIARVMSRGRYGAEAVLYTAPQGRSQGQGAVRMLILDLAGTTTYRKLFHLLKVNCFRTCQITYGITVGRAPKFVFSITW